MHIVFYLAIIIIDLIRSCIPTDTHVEAAAICDIIRLAVYSVCSVIFGMIVNSLSTKILAITANLKHTKPPSLMSEEAATNLVYEGTGRIDTALESFDEQAYNCLNSSQKLFDTAVIDLLFKKPTGPPIS